MQVAAAVVVQLVITPAVQAAAVQVHRDQVIHLADQVQQIVAVAAVVLGTTVHQLALAVQVLL